MRITRLRLHEFRGWKHLDLRPVGHVLIAGVPRAGRSDILAAVARVLEPSINRVQPSLADIRQTMTEAIPLATEELEPTGFAPEGTDAEEAEGPPASRPAEATAPLRAAFAEVEITLVDLDPELEQLCDGYLEPQDANGHASEEIDADPAAPLCVRIAYRVAYDALTDTLDQVIFFPARSNPVIGQYSRVPAAVRRALPVVVLSATRPLQLRAEGTLRRLLSDRDPEAAAEALARLGEAVNIAATGLSNEPVIANAVNEVLSAGGSKERLSDATLMTSPLTPSRTGIAHR